MARYTITTIWGPSGPQRSLFRRPDTLAPLPEQSRQQAGKYLGTAAYGVAVPIAFGRVRVPAILIEKNEIDSKKTNLVYLICEGEQDSLGRVSYNDKDAVAFEVDPASWVPGSETQTTNAETRLPYMGRMVSWRQFDRSQEIPSLSYEVNGGPGEELQETVLHDDGPASMNHLPVHYQAETFCRGLEAHLVYVLPVGDSWQVLYRRSDDGGFVWSSPLMLATVGHAAPSPIIFGDFTAAAVHIAWFHQRGAVVEVRECVLLDGAIEATRTVSTMTTTDRPGLTDASHLSGSARGGRVWIAWQCHPFSAEIDDTRYGSRGVDAACCIEPTNTNATWYRPSIDNASKSRSHQLRPDSEYESPEFDLRAPSVLARADGSALLAFHVAGRGFMVQPIVLNLDREQVEWDPSVYVSPSDPCGIRIYALARHKVAATTWKNAEQESQISRRWSPVPGASPYTPWHGLPTPFVDTRFRDWFYGRPSAIVRLSRSGSSIGGDYLLVYCPGPSLSGTMDAPTRWKINKGVLNGTDTTIDVPVDGFLHCPPRIAIIDEAVIVTATRAQVAIGTIGWNGDVKAWRWVISIDNTLVELSSKVVLVSGSDDVAHAALPTPHGMVMQQWGDFAPGDSYVGSASRLVAWDPTVMPEADVDPCGVIVRGLLSERHFGKINSTRSVDAVGLLQDVEATDAYTQEMGFRFSDAIVSQVNAWQHLVDLMASANCVPVASAGRIEWVPYEINPVGAWSPKASRSAPVRDLSPRDWLSGSVPTPSRRPHTEEKTILPVAYTDRAQNYRAVTLDVADVSGVAQLGRQKAGTVDCPWIHVDSMASLSGWCRLRRERAGATSWTVKLLPIHQDLTCMDIVTLNDPRVGLAGEWYRITRIVRHPDLSMTTTFEEVGEDFGLPSAPIAPADPQPPAVFYAPSVVDAVAIRIGETYAADGAPRVFVGACGAPGWMGCEVWRRWSGGPWERIGILSRGTPIGALVYPMSDLSPRDDLMPRDVIGLIPGLEDIWTADFSVSREIIPASGAFSWNLGRAPALAVVGAELIAHLDRTNAADFVSSGSSLRRGLWGTSVVDHVPGEKVAVFGGNHLEWLPDGDGMLEIRFPSLAVPGSLAEPLQAARSFFVEV